MSVLNMTLVHDVVSSPSRVGMTTGDGLPTIATLGLTAMLATTDTLNTLPDSGASRGP